ncbi:hypothetical protein [Edwardsiella tarda]|uniref:hypothetical protein n=1 Tax=Edwardsiella tarda TaxID=636 RepID=UPI0030816B91|nr:hypothetical protein GBS0709_20930 [Edwardsiella tarda]
MLKRIKMMIRRLVGDKGVVLIYRCISFLKEPSYILSFKKINVFGNYDVIKIGKENSHIYCGYYDRDPIKDDNILLYEVDMGADPSNLTAIKIGLYNIKNKSFLDVARVKAWCWQQGSRAHWYGENIIVNNIENGSFVSEIYNKSGDLLSSIPHPIYDTFFNKNIALSCDFERLQILRPGYGYYLNQSSKKKRIKKTPDDTGLSIIDMISGKSHLLLSLLDLSSFQPKSTMIDSYHYINHISFSPNGEFCIFYHLWVDENGVQYSRALSYDINNSILSCINSEYVSHFAWLNSTSIMIFSQENGIRGYHLYQMNHHNEWFYEKTFNRELLKEDGHPTFCNELQFISDTYPDRFGYQHLFSYDINTNVLKKIASLYSPYKYEFEERCDLHPRVHGEAIVIDSTCDGKRAVYIIKPGEAK